MPAIFTKLYYAVDGFLIFFFRISGHAFTDYLIGTFALALMCVVIGEFSVSLALKVNQRFIDQLSAEMTAKENLSMAAHEAGDQAGYRALNKEATGLWGKRFFTMVAYSAGILWPIPFALGWMQTRFQGVDFPLAFPLSLIFGKSVGYTFTFIPIYILCRITFKYLRPRLPYFNRVQQRLDHCDTADSR
ncbi:MAG: hypothetical protein JSW39_03665 [Desulfobacterales bacterium]|nr:MAG: hypothetical protein JSW39_03665 [Desulfobacterales bacterium]